MSFTPHLFTPSPSDAPLLGVTADELKAVDAYMDELFAAHNIPLLEQIEIMADREEGDGDPTAETTTDDRQLSTPSPTVQQPATETRRSVAPTTHATAVAITLALVTALMTSTTTTSTAAMSLAADTSTTTGTNTAVWPRIVLPPAAVGPAGNATPRVISLPARPMDSSNGGSSDELISPQAPDIVSITPLPSAVTLDQVRQQEQRRVERTRARPRRTAASAASAATSQQQTGSADEQLLLDMRLVQRDQPADVHQPNPRFPPGPASRTMPIVDFAEPPEQFAAGIMGVTTIFENITIPAVDREFLARAELTDRAPQFVRTALLVRDWPGYTALLSAYIYGL